MINLEKNTDKIMTEFDYSLNRVIRILEDDTLTEEYRMDIAEKFCQTYVYFDSSRFNKYFI